MAATKPIEADYVIVGGGLCGCALASRIKEFDSNLSVLVIEAGNPPTDKHDVVSPFGGLALAGTELDWQYQTSPAPALDNRTFALSSGKTLGGGSVLNYAGWLRGHAEDYNAWSRQVGDQRWGYDGLLPYMKKSERFVSKVDPAYHGFDGPFKVFGVLDSDPNRKYPLRSPVEAAWAEVGLPKLKSPGSGEIAGLSDVYENWENGRRQPAQTAYNMAGIEVLPGTYVSKVLTSSGSSAGGVVATGAELTDGRTVSAKKEVIVSSGTFQSPLVLLRSGLSIPTIGHNYADHFAVYQLWMLKNPERGLALGCPQWTDPAYFKGLPWDWVANDAPPREEMEKALDIDGVHGVERESLLKPGRTFVETLIMYTAMAPGVPIDGTMVTSSVMLTAPTSRGQVSLSTAAGEMDRPVITPNYLSTAFDKLCIIHGVKRLAQLMLATKAMESYVQTEVPFPGFTPITPASSDAEILDRVVKTGMPHFHPAGTCAMGHVVDTNLKVKGVDRLRVCDASVFPSPVGGHPMTTCYAVAEQGADIITKAG